MKIAIYGFGNVGKWMCRRLLNSQKFISDLSIYVYDDLKSTVELNHEYIKTFKNDVPDFLNLFGNDQKFEFNSIYGISESESFDLIYICVPTDSKSKTDGSCNTDIVMQIITEIKNNCLSRTSIILKSTVPPEFMNNLSKFEDSIDDAFIKNNLYYSPEFSSKGPHGGSEDFMILGSYLGNSIPQVLYELVSKSFPGSYKIHTCTWEEASICKYFINSFLAAKVLLCNEFAMLCHKYNANYNTVRNIVTEDKRIGSSHTFENESHSYKDSHCFMKDVKALAADSSEIMDMICAIRDINEARIELPINNKK